MNDLESKKGFLSLLKEISVHTDVWEGWTILLTVLTIIASLVTIFGVFGIVMELRKNKVSVERQRLMVKDVVRHLFINAAIMEVVRMKMEGVWGEKHPQEGVFSRFCVLDTDLQLSQIKVNDSQYTKLHSLSLFLRNYNIMSQLLEKHFCDPQSDPGELQLSLDDLWKRTMRITDDFLELGEISYLKLGRNDVRKFIVDHYEEKRVNCKKTLPDIQLPKREGNSAYYDDTKKLDLSEIFDFCLLEKYDEIRILSYRSNQK